MTSPGRSRLAGPAMIGLLLAAPAGTVEPQLTSTHYARAESFLPWNVGDLTYTARVDPNWIDGSDRFWYRSRSREGTEFVFVNPAGGERRPAFDHARLAAAMAEASGRPHDAHALPFREFKFLNDSRWIQFDVDTTRWRCNLTTDVCEPTAAPESPAPHEIVSPDGAWAAYTEAHNLYVRSLSTGARVRLTDDGEPYNDYGSRAEANQSAVAVQRLDLRLPPAVIWSPDSAKLVVQRLDQRDVEQLHIVQSTPPDRVRPRLSSYRMPLAGDEIIPLAELVIFDVEQRTRIPVEVEPWPVTLAGPIDFNYVFWSRDAECLYTVREERGFKKMTLHVTDTVSGLTGTILEETSDTYVDLNVDFYADNPNVWPLADGSEVIWFSERDGWAHLYLYSADTGGFKHQITSGEWVVRNLVHVDENERVAYFTAGGRETGRDPYYRHLYRIGLDGSHLQLLTPEDADHLITMSPGGGVFVDTYSRVDMAPTSVLRTTDGKLVTTLEKADVEPLLATGWSWPERFTVKARDGVTNLYGVLHLPTNFDPDKTYPVIDSIYPGPQTCRVSKSFPSADQDAALRYWFWDAEALAELGFIVFTIDGLGTPFRSKAFHDVSYGNLQDGGGLEDHIAGMRQLAERRPYMNLDRVGIFGGSSGGYATVRAILAYPDFYKVAFDRRPSVTPTPAPSSPTGARSTKATRSATSTRAPTT